MSIPAFHLHRPIRGARWEVTAATSVIAPPAGTDAEPQPAVVRRGAWRWWLGALLVLAVLRGIAPLVLEPWIESRLETALGAHAEVDDVDLRLLWGEIVVEGITATPTADSRSRLRIEQFAVRLGWLDLLRGLPFLHAHATGLDVELDADRRWPMPERAEGTGGSMGASLRSLRLDRGRLAVVMVAGEPPIDVVTDLRGSITDTATSRRATSLSTHVWLEASTSHGGSLAIEGLVSPVDSASSWSLAFVLERLDLRALNPVFHAFFEMDVEQGWLSLEGELNVGRGRMRGQIIPRFDNLELLGQDEVGVRHPMGEALFGAMLASADVPIIIDEPAPFEDGLVVEDVARVEPMALLEAIILRGFVRRLDTLAGYESKVERLEVDFPAGRLSFHGVTLSKKGGGVETPFVSVPRLDIVVEQSAVDSEVLTYKAITLHQPSLVFVTGASAATSQLQFDPLWQDKVSVLPYPTDRIVILGGKVEYRDDTTSPPTSLYAANIDLRVENIGRARVGTARRAASFVAHASVMDISPLDIEAELSPGVVPIDATVRLQLEPLPLRELNDLLRSRLQIDVTGGTLAIDTTFDAYRGHVQGTVRLAMPGIAVIGSKEVEFQRPIREFMLERRLRKLDDRALKVDYRVYESLLRELPEALLSAALHAE